MLDFITGNEAFAWVVAMLLLVLFILVLRIAAQRYAKGKVAIIMLAVEKKLATWVSEQAAGVEKHDAAVYLVKYLYPKLPKLVTILVSEAKAIEYIEDAYEQMLKLVDVVKPVDEAPTKVYQRDGRDGP